MKFGSREICNVVFKAKQAMTIGKSTFKKGQPVLYIDTAKTSTLEGAAETVYATGGRGNTRLIAWEGDKTLTFTVEDALLSPIGFSILSGAGLFQSDDEAELVHVHVTCSTVCDDNGLIDLSSALNTNEQIDMTAPIFVVKAESDGSLTGDIIEIAGGRGVDADGKTVDPGDTDNADKNYLYTMLQATADKDNKYPNGNVFVDFYMTKPSTKVSELQIDAEHFAGYFYVEASTLFRKQATGKDMPAELTFPNVKIQSNFTFNMAATGDPSTFTFTMDAFPGYTIFDATRKVLCVIQYVDEDVPGKATNPVMPHKSNNAESDEIVDNGSAAALKQYETVSGT